MLTRLLTPADLMLMIGNVCTARDPSFLAETAGKRGDFRFYAQEVKDEVSHGVPAAENLLVLRQAADVAKAGVIAQVGLAGTRMQASGRCRIFRSTWALRCESKEA